MRILIWCDTYYQLILAIQMRKTVFADCKVDAVITDGSVGASRVAENLRGAHVFEEVAFVQNRDVVAKSRKDKRLLCFLLAALGKMPSVMHNAYDEVVFYGLHPWLYGIGDYSVRQGKDVRWSRFDEGIFSYDRPLIERRRPSILETLRRLTGKYTISNSVSQFYCCFPEIKNNSQEWELKRIPAIDSSSKETIEILKHCFGYKELPYPQKYIYLSMVCDLDGLPFAEEEVVLKLAEVVGADNLLVKKHPRDTSPREIYRQHGISVIENSEVPWEVIQLCANLTDRVLLTTLSGSFLAISAMSAYDIKALFLVTDVSKGKFLEGAVLKYKEKIEALHNNNYAMNVEMISFSEFCDRLKKTQEKDSEPSEAATEGSSIHA